MRIILLAAAGWAWTISRQWNWHGVSNCEAVRLRIIRPGAMARPVIIEFMDRTERFYRIQQMLRQSRVVPVRTFLRELEVSLATFKVGGIIVSVPRLVGLGAMALT